MQAEVAPCKSAKRKLIKAHANGMRPATSARAARTIKKGKSRGSGIGDKQPPAPAARSTPEEDQQSTSSTIAASPALHSQEKRPVRRKRSTSLKQRARSAQVKSVTAAPAQVPAALSSSSADPAGSCSSQAAPASASADPSREAALLVVALTFCSITNLGVVLEKELSRSPPKGVLDAALIHCAGRGSAACVQRLLDAQASADARDSSRPRGRRSALEMAIRDGHMEVCRVLVSGGAAQRDEDAAAAAAAAQRLASYGKLFAKELAELQVLLPKPGAAAEQA